MTNINNNEKALPEGEDAPSSEEDLSDLGFLLTQLAKRKPAETDEALIQELKPCVSPKDLYRVIHGESPDSSANFAGTIYEFIMKLLGKVIPRGNANS